MLSSDRRPSQPKPGRNPKTNDIKEIFFLFSSTLHELL